MLPMVSGLVWSAISLVVVVFDGIVSSVVVNVGSLLSLLNCKVAAAPEMVLGINEK